VREEEGVLVGGLRAEAEEEEDLLDFLRIETGEGAAAEVDMFGKRKRVGSVLRVKEGREEGKRRASKSTGPRKGRFWARRQKVSNILAAS